MRRARGRYLAALDQLLLRGLVPVGRGGVLSGGDGLSGCCRRLFGCVLTGNRKRDTRHEHCGCGG